MSSGAKKDLILAMGVSRPPGEKLSGLPAVNLRISGPDFKTQTE